MQTAIDLNLFPTNLESMIRPVPVVDGKLYQIPVAASSVLRQLGEELFRALDTMAMKPLPISEEDVVESFEYLLAARCAYVSGICRMDGHPKDIEYPSVIFPVLAAVGRFIDTSLNVTIVPVPKIGYQGIVSQDGEFPDHQLKVDRKKQLAAPAKYGLVMSTFRAYGVNTARGLPMDKDVESDDLYRLDEMEGALMGGKKEPSSHNLYARAMLEMQYLAALYGETRVMYLALSSLRSGIYDLVARQVRGPSRRVD